MLNSAMCLDVAMATQRESPTKTMPQKCLEKRGTQNKEPWTSETPKMHPKHLTSQAITRRQANEGIHTEDLTGATGKLSIQRDKQGHSQENGNGQPGRRYCSNGQGVKLVIGNTIVGGYCSSPSPEAETG